MDNNENFEDFGIDIKADIVDIINDSPSLAYVGEKQYVVKGLRFYSLYRIARLTLAMRKADETLDDDNKVITALCTDLDAMCEIVAIILCNHLFTADGARTYDDAQEILSKNDKLVSLMKTKVLCSTFDVGQWAAIVIAALKSIDLSAFFLLKKSASSLIDSLMKKKRKAVESASQFTEAQSLATQPTS